MSGVYWSDDVHDCPYVAVATVATSRRAFFRRLLALSLGVSSAAAVLGACDDDGSSMMGGPTADGMPDWMMSEGSMGGQTMRDMRVIRDLLANHDEVQRRVRDVPGGIRSVTTSSNQQIADRIQTHVWQMKERVEDGEAIRQMDPVFREIFDHHKAIHMEIQNVDRGVQVTETSDDPQVVLLIRQHARRAVSEFVAQGMSRAMQSTPLPSGYRREGSR